ncbi:hypothetical protein F4780DRAFT_771238 [Xylariomycetidae sp. FL0641]|nr:hypothetical protein F4780DRAFT_771238 [Xylariomycetidae sp. FL0641]
MSTSKGKDRPESLSSAIDKATRKASNPELPQETRAEGQQEFDKLTSTAPTLPLLFALNTLRSQVGAPRWYRDGLRSVLAKIPQRPDGVRATFEFVCSVHPSSTVKASEAAEPQKQGANITMEAQKMATNLIAAPPVSVSDEDWYKDVAPQLLALLDGKDGPDLSKVAAYIIGFGILGRKAKGAPGTPGWKAFTGTMLGNLNPSLNPPLRSPLSERVGPDEVLDVRKAKEIVSPQELQASLKRLTTLLNAHPNPGLTNRLLAPLLLPLWCIASRQNTRETYNERYRQPAQKLLETYLTLSFSVKTLQFILDNLSYDGETAPSGVAWVFRSLGEDDIHIRLTDEKAGIDPTQAHPLVLEPKAEAFAELTRKLGDATEVSKFFLALMESAPLRVKGITLPNNPGYDEEDLLKRAARGLVYIQMMTRVPPDRLVASPEGMLELIKRLLWDASEAGKPDESTSGALSLLNMVVGAAGFQRSKVEKHILTSIEYSLEEIAKFRDDPEVSRTAHNVFMLLTYRDALEDPTAKKNPTAAPTERQVEDRRTYNLALQYITQADSPAPVRAEGVNLLSRLVDAQSPILDIPATLTLFSTLLDEGDDYISNRVFRAFAELSLRHPRSTVTELLDRYVDPEERTALDTRLAFGEALVRVVQIQGEAFTGQLASMVGEALLALAGRRTERPREAARQEREARRAERAARNAWGEGLGGAAALPAAAREEMAAFAARTGALTASLEAAWAERRGAEDLRVRTSALSLLGLGLQAHPRGFPGALTERALGLALDALTLEPGPGPGILRRAAADFVHLYVRALGEARAARRHLPFGLPASVRARVEADLRRARDADDDPLVRSHAAEALASLAALRQWELLPPCARDGDDGSGIPAALRGLVDRPPLPALRDETQGLPVRPKIEEVE